VHAARVVPAIGNLQLHALQWLQMPVTAGVAVCAALRGNFIALMCPICINNTISERCLQVDEALQGTLSRVVPRAADFPPQPTRAAAAQPGKASAAAAAEAAAEAAAAELLQVGLSRHSPYVRRARHGCSCT
jgi:hypothetical protein